MTTSDLKRQLKEALNTYCRYEIARDKADEFEAKICYAKPVSYNSTGAKIEHNSNAQQDANDMLISYREEEEQYYKNWISARRRVDAIIQLLIDPREIKLLTKHYLDGKEWKVVAEEMAYSEKQIHRLHSSALQFLAEKMSVNVLECQSIM